MCGIFGVILNENSAIPKKTVVETANSLFKLSESRGNEAAGIAIKSAKGIYVYKAAESASRMISSEGYRQTLKKVLGEYNPEKNDQKRLILIGHSRLVTNGSQASNDNNQPVTKDGIVGIHNGIIVNDAELWERFKNIKRECEVDTEIFLGMIHEFSKDDNSLIKSIQRSYNNIEGSASVALIFDNNPYLALATNTGSLYVAKSKENSMLVFASEKYILKTLLKKRFLKDSFKIRNIKQIKPFTGLVFDAKLEKTEFRFDAAAKKIILKNNDRKLFIKDLSKKSDRSRLGKEFTLQAKSHKIAEKEKSLLEYNSHTDLKRCSRCILPDTFPGIKFDSKGVCNFCRDNKKKHPIGIKPLEKVLSKYRSKSGAPDCLVAFSGGRDSSYGLHYIKNVLKMNPITFTYDWGMVTDIARRNQARMCGKLGIEHILVSANISKKRENIRKNIKAWLKKPQLSMVPLFMAGDKQFFYYANKLMKHNNLKLMIFCENELYEKTNFKTGFCGIKEGNKRWAEISILKKLRLATYYFAQYMKNPAYINASVWDSLFAYFSTYFVKHNYLFVYRYTGWDEDELNKTLIEKYNWEIAKDLKSTWRIGDGTAAFYNYIYYTVAGFTEFDTFRSNQIRYGVITRKEALDFVRDENKPRYDSIRWYCGTIGINFEKTIRTINKIPKLYKKTE